MAQLTGHQKSCYNFCRIFVIAFIIIQIFYICGWYTRSATRGNHGNHASGAEVTRTAAPSVSRQLKYSASKLNGVDDNAVVSLTKPNPSNNKDLPPHANIGNGENEEDGDGSGDVARQKEKKRLPDFLIIGVAKAGTRALINFVRMHPNVTTAKSELHFFDDDDEYDKGLDYYAGLFPEARPQDMLGEKTPKYFVHPKVPERVYRMNPKIKLVLTLVDPVHRLMSQYMQFSENKPDYESFSERVIGSDGYVDTSYKPVTNSIYIRHLKDWVRYFPLKSILIVNGGELKTNPYKVTHRMEEYLGLPNVIGLDRFRFNATKKFFCPVKENGVVKCLNKTKGRPHQPIEKHVYEKLLQFYHPYNLELYKFLGRDFGWPAPAAAPAENQIN